MKNLITKIAAEFCSGKLQEVFNLYVATGDKDLCEALVVYTDDEYDSYLRNNLEYDC